MPIVSRRLSRLIRLTVLLLVFDVYGIGYPERSQHSFTFRPRDPAPRSSNDAAKLELSATGAVFGFKGGQTLIEHGSGTHQRGRLVHAVTVTVDPYDDSWKHRGDKSSTSSAPNSSSALNSTQIEAAPAFTLGAYGLSPQDVKDPRVGNMTNFTHTWGDQKSNVMGLPSWAAVLVGGTAAAIIVICTNSIGGRLSHPLPFFASPEQKLKDQIEQTKEKVRLLEDAVKRKREQELKAAEEEAKKQRGEIVKEDTGPTHDELVGEMLYRTQEVQEQAVGAVNDSLKQAAPLLARAAYVQNVFSVNMKVVQERAADMAFREASNIYGKMREAVGIEEGDDAQMGRSSSMAGYDLPDWFQLDDENDLDPPPFALLLGGMFAPAQIKLTRGNCQTQIVWNSIMIAICTACAVIDGHHLCPDEHVWAWLYGMLALNFIDILCCSFIAAKCASAIGVLSDDDDKIGRIPETGNAVWDAFIAVQTSSGQFFKAYFKYQNIIDGPIYTFQKFMCFVSLVWGFLGIYVTCQDIVEDTLMCDAKVVLWFMHAYSFFFMLFLTWTTLGLILWVMQKMSGLTCITAPIMKSAKSADDEVPFKMPLFQTLARSFLLRDSSTMLKIKARQLEEEVAALEVDVEDNKNKLEQRKAYLEQLERQKSNAYANERQLIDEYKEKKTLTDGPLQQITSGIGVTMTGVEGLTAEDLFAQASTAAASLQETGLTTTLQQTQQAAQLYAQESGLTQGATDVFSSVQRGATDTLARTQELVEERGMTQGATDVFSSVQRGATDALARTQELAEERGITQGATDVFSSVQQGATDTLARTQELAEERGLTQATGSSSSRSAALPETQSGTTDPLRPEVPQAPTSSVESPLDEATRSSPSSPEVQLQAPEPTPPGSGLGGDNESF